jgi:DNA-binding MarR family transcriptional regulator
LAELDQIAPMQVYQSLVDKRYGAGEEYSAAIRLVWVGRHIAAHIDSILQKFDLNMPQWSTLMTLHLPPGGSMPLGKIARALHVHGTTITNAVDRLVALGLVKRTWDPNDRRTVFVSATPAGVRRADAVMRALAKDKFGLPVLGVEDIETLVAVTKKLPPW